MLMTMEEFEMMQPGVFFLKLFYFNKAKKEKMMLFANLIRLQTVQLLNIQLPATKKITDASQLWSFPWDKEGRVRISVDKKMLDESADRLIKLASKLFN